MFKEFLNKLCLLIKIYGLMFSFLSLVFLFFSCNKFEDHDEKLYFVVAYSKDYHTSVYFPNDNLNQRKFIAAIYKFEKDSVYCIDTINFDFEREIQLDRLLHFPTQKFFYLEETEIISDSTVFNSDFLSDGVIGGKYISIFDYSDGKLILRKYSTERDTQFYRGNRYLNYVQVNSNYVVFNDWNYVGDEIVRYGVDKDLLRYVIDESHFTNIFNPGVSGFQGECLGSFKYVNGALRIGKKFDSRSMSLNLKSNLNPPDSLGVINRLYIVANDPAYRFVVATKELNSSLIIYDKFLDSWSLDTLPGASYRCRVYGNWLYGVKYEYFDFSISNNLFALQDSFYKYIPINKRITNSQYGHEPQLAGLSGELFLYHIPTKTTLILKMTHRDSEILRIKDSWVYYRNDSEIRRIYLDELNMNLVNETDVLIFKNNLLCPHIHNIFWSAADSLVINKYERLKIVN